jgi:hypothetical protein
MRTRLAYRTDTARGWRKGEPLRFVHRHRLPPLNRGPSHANYRGGLGKHDGRWWVTCRDGSRIAYSRAVMAAHVGRLLTPAEIVHHRDGDPTNDALSNLQIVTRAEHIAIHMAGLLASRGL